VRIIAVPILSLVVAGCAMTPDAVQRPVCSDGYIPIRFNTNAAALTPRLARELEWPARAILECSSVRLNVVGLPGPSGTTLENRRAHSVVQALAGFGAPEPTFEPGTLDEQSLPVLEVFAAPR